MSDCGQIFCFPYAGGTAAFFDVIEAELPDFELNKMEYPGHGERHRETCASSFCELADDMYRCFLQAYRGGSYALFGYSMGTITLVEVLRRILEDGEIPLPKRIFLAAHEPHSKAELEGFAPDELDEWVKERTIRFGDVPERLMNNKVFWRTYLPLYRADYAMIGAYKFEELNLNTDIPVTVFYSETDTPLKEMKGWERYFTGRVDYHVFDGTHFFIRQHHEEIADFIRSDLT